jgi:intracellular sulfur oxidation DsrE/DsrF family protein
MAADTFVSRADAGYSNVTQSVKNLLKFVKSRVEAGDIEVIIKKQGIRVLSVHCTMVMRRIRMLVSAIAAQTLCRFDYFSDAEVDFRSPF